MKKTTVTTAILLTFLFASLSGTVSAQTYVPGVKVGDAFKYQYEFTADVNSSQQVTIPTPFDALVEQAKAIDWIQITITGVSGNTVTAQTLTQYKTGTQQSYTGTANVATGSGTLIQFLLASNLTANSPLYEGNNEKINGTTTKTYTSGVTREVNYQNLSSNYNIPQSQVSKYNITVPLTQVNTQEAYWDKQTGALTQLINRMETTSTQVNATLYLSLNLVESNVFAVPEYPFALIALAVLAVPTVLVLKERKNYF